MTIVIEKVDSKEVIKKKFDRLLKPSSMQKKKTFKQLCSSIKDAFKEDALELQHKWRSEWG